MNGMVLVLQNGQMWEKLNRYSRAIISPKCQQILVIMT